MKYFVNIEETVNGVFEVEAESREEAFNIARQKYNKSMFVNEPGNLTYARASVATKDGEFKQWKEL